MRVVFTKTLYDSRKLIFWLFVGYALYGMMIGAIYPFMVESAEDYNNMIDKMPKEMFAVFGLDPDTFDMANMGQFLHMEMMIWLLIVAGTIAIYQAFSAFTNAERDNSIDVLLSLPISRRENLLGQFAVTVVTVFIALLGGCLGVIVTTPLWSNIDFALIDIVWATMSAMVPLMVIISLSYLLTAVVPSSKRFAGAVAYVFWIGGYMIFGVTSAVEPVSGLKVLFVYNYYNAGEIVNQGINWGDWTLLLVISAILLGLAWWKVDSKELGI